MLQPSASGVSIAPPEESVAKIISAVCSIRTMIAVTALVTNITMMSARLTIFRSYVAAITDAGWWMGVWVVGSYQVQGFDVISRRRRRPRSEER